MKITLTINEYCHAVREGATRMQISSAQGNREHSNADGAKTPQQLLFEEIIGMCSEMAFAKLYSGYAPMEINSFKSRPDVTVNHKGIEVRGTRMGKRLILRPGDKAVNRPYVHLQRITDLEYKFKGWIHPNDLKDEWIADPNGRKQPAWFVPNDALRSIEELNEWINE